MSSTSLYFLSRDLTKTFFNLPSLRWTILIRVSRDTRVGRTTIARRLEAVRAISQIFFKSMNWLTEGLADDEHGLIFIDETSSSMSRWFQPSKQSPSTRKMSMNDTAHMVCTWISSTRKVSATSFSRDQRALRNMTSRRGSIR